jgi:hypothetical protein
MFDTYVSHLIAFLGGATAGAAGQYFATKYTEKRQSQEQKKKLRKIFNELNAKMPKLFKEMRNDLLEDKSELVAEFVVLRNRKIPFSSSKKRFYYFEEDHPDLQGKIDLLVDHGFIADVRTGNAPIYRMSHEFIDLLKAV